MIFKRVLALLLCFSILWITAPAGFAQTGQSPKLTNKDLDQLVAPIALYPDALVAQILAASTYPTEVVEADRWMQQHSNLRGKHLADEVNEQDWDPSVKALTQFPSELANMDRNLSWTSSLGDAYMNQPQDVMNAVQVMRRRAEKAGYLKSTPQENVVDNGQTIVIDPVNPALVYLPVFDPWICYGPPIVMWPGWYWYPGLYVTVPGIAFGVGFGIGFFSGFAWGWPRWGFNWGNRTMLYNHRAFVSQSRAFVNRDNFYRGSSAFSASRFGTATHRYTAPGSSRGTHSSAFSGFKRGGFSRAYSFRGRSSFGGGFGARGFGGGFHGGGGRR